MCCGLAADAFLLGLDAVQHVLKAVLLALRMLKSATDACKHCKLASRKMCAKVLNACCKQVQMSGHAWLVTSQNSTEESA